MVELSSWLVQIDLTADAAFKNEDEVNDLIREIEDVAAAAGFTAPLSVKDAPLIDVIFVEFHLHDHCHQLTLEQFDRKIPVVAAKDAADMIRPWEHFEQVTTIGDIQPGNGDWQALHPGAPLPAWFSIFRMVGHTMLNFASALVWKSDEGKYESLLLSPHVIKAKQPTFNTYAKDLSPAIETLAVFSPLKTSYSMGFQTVLGAPGVLPIARLLRPKYWIKSADAHLLYQGLILKTVRDIRVTLEEALEEETKTNDDITRPSPNLVEVGNGQCFVLA